MNHFDEEDFDFLDLDNKKDYEQEESESCSLDDDECVSCGS